MTANALVRSSANLNSDAALDVRRMRRPQLAPMTALLTICIRSKFHPRGLAGGNNLLQSSPRLRRRPIFLIGAARDAQQNFDDNKRHCQDDKHQYQQHAARHDCRFGVGFDDGRRCDLSNINPARSNGGWQLDIYPSIDPRSLQGGFIWQHLRHRFVPLGLIDFLLNSMDLTLSQRPCRVPLKGTCRVPAMILAMPVEVH